MLYYRHHPHPPREAEVDPSNEAGSPLQGAEIDLLVAEVEVVAERDLLVDHLLVAEAEVVLSMVRMVDQLVEGMEVG